MEVEREYQTAIVGVRTIDEYLNNNARDGWVLHTILDWKDGQLLVIMEGVMAYQEPRPEPMRMT